MGLNNNNFNLRFLLLDLLSSERKIDKERLLNISREDWVSILDMARSHRLGPLLYWNLKRKGVIVDFDPEILQLLFQFYQQSVFRSLQIYRELVLVHRLLKDQGIPHIALKGAYLAFKAYPNPALRPLRDLDILVPSDKAVTAFNLLVNAGYSRIQKYGYGGSPEVVMNLSQHLPPLCSSGSAVTVELHTKIFHVDRKNVRSDLSDDPDFWARAGLIEIGGEVVPTESATDLLLHLIIHAIYDHEFNNGPLTLSDLALLIRSQPIDWELFWSMADKWGYVKGCQLALTLAEFYWGHLPIDWCGDYKNTPHFCSNDDLQNLAALMLQDFYQRGVSSRNAELSGKSLFTMLKYVYDNAFVSRAQMSKFYQVRHDGWLVLFMYPVRWYRLLSHRLASLLNPIHTPTISTDVELLKKLHGLLAD